jgi:hypothetical protein
MSSVIILSDLASKGANLIIESNMCTVPELVRLVETVTKNGGHITIHKAHALNASELEMIVRRSPKSVTLDMR